jgi:hypothetical protein
MFAKLKRKWFPNYTCYGCGKLLIRWKDRHFGSFQVTKTNPVKKRKIVVKERFCCKCGKKVTTDQVEAMGKVFGKRPRDWKWRGIK